MEKSYMTNIPPRRIGRPPKGKSRQKLIPEPPPGGLKRGPAPDPNLEKCDCNITTLITQAEYQRFEKLRLRMVCPPTRSQWARFLIRESLDKRFRRDLPGNAPDYRNV